MAKPYMCGDDFPVYIPGDGCDCNYTIEQIENPDYAASYILKLNGEQVGNAINVPKDMVISSGKINTVIEPDVPYEGALIGDKYLSLSIANSSNVVNVPMKDLVSSSYVIVDELPESGSSNVIYLVPDQGGGYDRYIYLNGEWVNIGNEEIDLSNYYTKSEVNTLLEDYIEVDSDGDAQISGDFYANEHYTTKSTLSLGAYQASGTLTGDADSLLFSIPTGRVFPPGTTITKLTFTIACRASSAGPGYYIVHASSPSYSAVPFDSTSSFTFYNANNQAKTIPLSKITVTLNGGTNILVWMIGEEGAMVFAGNATLMGKINNNAVAVTLDQINVDLSIPS